jgi:pimeloyl-ACP methyl ester carboxylesterase
MVSAGTRRPRDPCARWGNLARIETLELHASGLTFDALADGPRDGRVVLLLHGFPQTSRSWRRVMPHLAAAGHRVIAPDLRGYSPRARTGPYDVRTLVQDVLALAPDGPFDLVGHDWGAAIAWQTAIRHHERVRTLTALSVPHPLAFTQALRSDADQQRRSAYMRRFATEDDPPLDVAEGAGDLARPEAIRAGLEYYRAASAQDLEGLGPVTVPTLFVWSTEDRALGRTGAELTEQHVTGPYRFVVLEGISHWIPEEAPSELARLLLDHFASA